MVEFDVVIAEFLNLKKKYGLSCWLSFFHCCWSHSIYSL